MTTRELIKWLLRHHCLYEDNIGQVVKLLKDQGVSWAQDEPVKQALKSLREEVILQQDRYGRYYCHFNYSKIPGLNLFNRQVDIFYKFTAKEVNWFCQQLRTPHWLYCDAQHMGNLVTTLERDDTTEVVVVDCVNSSLRYDDVVGLIGCMRNKHIAGWFFAKRSFDRSYFFDGHYDVISRSDNAIELHCKNSDRKITCTTDIIENKN